MNVIASPDQIKYLSGVLEQHCEKIGRDPAEIQKTVHVPIRLIHDEKKAKEARGDNDWAMMGSPQYVIDRIGDFLDVGVMEFTPQIRPQNPEVYQELDETVFSAFD